MGIFSTIIYFEREMYSLISYWKTFTKWHSKCSENTHKMLAKKCILGRCTLFEFTTMDQHEPDNTLYIPVDTPTKFNKHKRLIWGPGLILTCHVRSFKFVCPLRCRNISKLLNGKSAHFRFKPHRKNKSLNTKTYFYLY